MIIRSAYLMMFALCFVGIGTLANVRLPKLFGDNMVLQRNTLIPVWGWADANEKIEIKFNNQVKSVKADKTGKWIVRLGAESAGGPFEISIKGKNTIQIKNVLVGEVWICSGQSNMEFTVNEAVDAKNEMKEADFPMIRHFDVANEISSLPKDDVKNGKWEVCSKTTVGNFTAVGYFFAKKIHAELKVPIGLINSSWGGTNAEAWTSREAFENSNEFREMIKDMPVVSLDSISSVYINAYTKKIEALHNTKINKAATSSYQLMSFNDANWAELDEPKQWESQELGELDGVVWLRKAIQVEANDAGKAATIELAMIFDEDITYINGIEVGRNDKWNAKRNYTIPAGVLKEGKNVIAIRIVDNGGSGGIFGKDEDLKLITANGVIPLNGKWKYQVEAIFSNIGKDSYPTLLYNAMINPLIPYAIKGVLWYQGESNAWRAYEYRKVFPLLINDWRKKWNRGDFPFYFVQLASYNISNGNSNNGSRWAELREAQTQTLQLPNTAMCVTTDIGNPTDVHPANKQDVGKRLAAVALHNLYGKNMFCSGPSFKSMEVQGDKIMVSFANIGSGLSTPDKYGYIKGFEIAGSDRVFYYAKAFIENDKVIIYSENVEAPVAVHFGWADDAGDDNLYNKEGFPAVPFRTDEWKTLTKEEKYKIVKTK